MRKLYKIVFLFVLVYFNSVLNAKNISNDINLLLPTATITTNTPTVCLGGTSPQITITGLGGTAPYTFVYKIGTGPDISIVSTGAIAKIDVPTTTAGVYTYSLVSVTDSSGTQTQTGSATVRINEPPTVDFTFTNNSSCSGTPILFSSSVTGTGPFTYLWDFGNGSTSTQQNPNFTYTELGCGNAIRTVKLTVTGGGCTVIKTKTITIKEKPDVSFSDTINPFNPFNNCANASSNSVYSITVGNTSVSACISSFSIDWGDGNSQADITFPISHTYTAIGAYSMTITATGNNGCVSTKTYIVKNVSNPIGGLNSPGSTQNLCAPTTNLQFSISNWGGNSLDTTYRINYSDGSPVVILTQNQMNSSAFYNSSAPLNSANYPIPHTYTTSSCPVPSFEVKLEITNACGMTPLSLGNISVLTTPAANFTVPATRCVNNSILFTNTTISGYGQNCAQGSIYTWDFGDGTPIITTPVSAPQNISHTYSNIGTYTVTLTSQNGCGISSKTQQICIEGPLVPTFTLNNTGNCAPLAVKTTNTTNLTDSCAPPTYLWAVTYSPTNCGTSSNYTLLNGTTLTSFAPEFNFINPGTYALTLTTTNSCGSVTSPQQTVVVKQPPTVTISPITNVCQTGSSTVINPTAIVPACANAAYAWSFSGGTPSTSTLAVPGAISYSTAGNYTVSLSVTNECGTTIAIDKVFTINPLPTITGTLFSCVGFTSQLNGSTTAATTSPWTSSNPSIATVSPTGLVTAVSGGTTTITYTNTNNCKTTEVFTVNPAPTITPLVSSTVCIGGSPTALSFTITGATGTPTYQWYSNTANNTTTGTAIPGEINISFTPTATAVGTLYYYCIITLPTGGCSNIKTNTATVVATSLPTISTQPLVTQNLCVGGTIPTPLSVTASGGTGTLSYQWYSNTTNSTTGSIPVGTNLPTYTPPTFNAVGSFYYYVVVTASGSGCGTVTSTFSEVVVVADASISVQPLVTQTQCQGATPTNLTVTATGGIGTFSYQWYRTATPTTTGGNPVGTNATSYTPSTNAVGTFYYYCEVSQTGLGCSVKSNIATVVVVTAPQITTEPQSQSVCSGTALAPLTVAFSNGTGTATYQWYDDSGVKVGTNSDTYTPTNTVTTGYYCIITFSAGGCSSITSNTATITINPQPTISLQPVATQNICVGGKISTPLSVTSSGGTGTPSYQWYSTTNNSPTGGTAISGAISSTYTPPVLTSAQTFNYYVVITYSSGGCSTVTSDLAQIVVVNDPVVTSPLVMQTVCQNSLASVLSVVASGGIGTYSYQWFSSVSNSNSGGNLILSETSNIFTPPTTVVGTLYYYCVITQTGIGCDVTSTTAKVTVNLAPAFTTTLASSTLCLGQSPSPLTIVTNSDSLLPNYQWYSNITNLNSGGTQLSGATNATFNPPNSIAGTTYYYCIVTFPSITGGCSEITSSPAEVIINPNPVISNKSTLICSGNSFAISPDNLSGDLVPAGTTYTWSNPIISPAGSITGALAQNIQQTNISQTLINTTVNPAIVTYTVVPLSGVCKGIPFTVVVTVNPAISSNVTSTNSACFSANNGAIQTNITGGIPPYIISWTGPNGFTSAAASISNLAPGNYFLSITDQGGCPINEPYSITEPADIIITTDLEKDITCFNAANGEIKITLSGGTLNYKINWTRNGIPYAITEDLSNLIPGNYAVTVSDANNCGPKTATFTITEPPILVLNLANKTNILCFGQSTGTIDVNVSGGTLPYSYSWIGPKGFTSATQNLTALFAGTYNLIVTDNLGCIKNLSVILTQNSEIKITATTTPIVCYGDNNASINLLVSGGVAPYSIAWSNLGSGTFQNNLSAGDYLITVTDALNCVQTLNVNIPEAPIFTVNPVVKNISCFGLNNGSINLNFIGGIAPIKLTWSDGAVTGTTRNNLKPGSYTVTIIDSKPCTIVRTFIILEPQQLVLAANLTNALDCNNANTGAINLLVSGGSTPFTYAWSNGATTEDLSNIPAGNYLVTVTDVNGCTKQAQYSINRPPPIVTAVVTKTDFDCQTKFVKQTFVASVSGGVPPYQLVWSSGTISGANNEFMNTSQNGTVSLIATDAIGCQSTYSFNVNTPKLGSPSFDYTSFGYTNYGSYSINDPIQFTNTSSGDFVSILWDFGDGSFSSDLNPIHTYVNAKDYVVTQTVTYPFGCIYEQKITLIVEKGYVLVVPTAFTPNNDKLNDTFKPVTKALKNVSLYVYDTWGSMIYSESGDALRGWDGKIKSSNAENGNYYCKVSGETFYGTIINENHPFVLIK